MARFLSQTLIRTTSSASNSLQTFKLGISMEHRFSSQSGKAQLIEVDLESDGEVEVLGLRKLEDAIHSIIVRQSAPDWLPFVPGSSYWVPPRRHRPDSLGMINVLRKFRRRSRDAETEESMAVSSSRGWPSSAYFFEGTTTIHPLPVEVEAEVVHSNENMSDAEDEEG
ncbi:uncharacterized protein LOC112500800 [Cynara cardunculus var. scolymus]|uniref:Uncharacterized protein n=1 Tax=Cynara cardunculus var. scolymus TaxID=59895 RepID=A0A103Y2Q5_CYNCS|nr:uncharacterized protein LOC112500800 [Cynara cardunculus var. scolymus]XP_024960151.1 uncharacterized protein LOC112500800 [Cynara cardunculus var. scolymus]KVI01429.1 hypothetical protein Ccrd_020302 [Cynara cardunculus var. scolymus]